MPNKLVVDNTLGDQDFTIGSGADIDFQGTGNNETVNVQGGVNVDMNLSAGQDRVNLTGDASEYEIKQNGFTGFELQNSNGKTINLNVSQDSSPKTVAFANGSAPVSNSNGTISIGNANIGPGNSAVHNNINFDPNDASPIADGGGGGGGSTDGLPDLPPSVGGSGSAEVDPSNNTELSENIDADQDGFTISGGGGYDRFVFSDPDNTQDVTIEDFSDGDQLYFDGNFVNADVSVINADTNDDALTIGVAGTQVELINLPSADDVPILGTTSFEDEFSTNDALNFA